MGVYGNTRLHQVRLLACEPVRTAQSYSIDTNPESTKMIANAPTFDTITGIDYTVTRTAQGWELIVWEEATVTEQRICPFLWKLRLELPTINEVNSTLQAIVGQ